MLAEGIDIEAVLNQSTSRDNNESAIKYSSDQLLVLSKFHMTNPFRELLLLN